MQAIRTRYHGATNTKGSRFSAKGEAKTMYFPFDYSDNSGNNHESAAYAYANSLGWLNKGDTLEGGVFGHDTYWILVRGKC